MIKMTRVCVPVGLDCNFQCKYCYRGLSIGGVPTKISPLMKEFLQYLDPKWCQSLVISGGEPLLYMDTVREMFELAKPIHKKFMTNASLLTQDIVDYFNSLDVEVMVSHDGAQTKYLRGRDVLEEPELLNLIRQIKVLTISAVPTNRNPDVMENYRDTAKKLGRTDFYYQPGLVIFNGHNQDLIDGFDYDTYARSLKEERYYLKMRLPYYSDEGKALNFNVDLDGNIIDKDTLVKYGTVLDDREVCIARAHEIYKDGYCFTSNCPLKDTCGGSIEEACEHICKTLRMRAGIE